jgi:hypothetical protein
MVEDMEVDSPPCLLCSLRHENPLNLCFCDQVRDVDFDAEALERQITESLPPSMHMSEFLDDLIIQGTEYIRNCQVSGDGHSSQLTDLWKTNLWNASLPQIHL